jgi:hypothetical protein
VPPIVHDVLDTPGQPLDTSTRALMESRFGHDFSQVRVHADTRAAKSAQAVNALAYTVGNAMVFGTRQYTPTTGAGQKLLAHELAHVVQQGGGAPQSASTIGPTSGGLEAEAERAAGRVTTGNVASISGRTAPLMQRNPGWSSDTLEVSLEPLKPTTPPQISYAENGFLSQRMSSSLPLYQGPFCQNVTLPFECNVFFQVDYSDVARPQPFTPPQVSVEFEFSPPRGGFKFSKSDKKPTYVGQGKPLKTSFGSHFNFGLAENGPFKMTFKLFDPDTGITRLYDDTINIEAKRPCV